MGCSRGSKTVTNKQIFVALGGIALIAVPASAQNSAAPKAGKTTAVDQKKYCLAYDNIVGSRVRSQECKTRSEWAREGVRVIE